MTFVLLLAGAGGFYAYQKFSAEKAAPAPVDESAGQIELLVATKVVSPVLSFDSQKIWFITAQGKMFRKTLADSSAPEEYVLPEVAGGLIKILWPQSGNNFIAEFAQDGHIRYKLFKSGDNRFLDYPAQMRQVNFLGDGSKIVYDWTRSDGGHQLMVADADGANFQKAAELYFPNFMIAPAPRGGKVLIFVSDDTSLPAKMYEVILEGGGFQQVAEEGFYAGAKFSPDGREVLTNLGGNLAVVDLVGLQKYDLGPGDIEAAIWTNHGREVLLAQGEKIVKKDPRSGTSETVFASQDLLKLNSKDLVLHPTEPWLFFVDSQSGYLYQLKF